jgi:hypothetical protein
MDLKVPLHQIVVPLFLFGPMSASVVANPLLTEPASCQAICILGMHRGGTSALAGMLNYLGVDLSDRLMPNGPDNPKGFWEHGQIVGYSIGLLSALNSHFDDIRPLPPGWENSQPALSCRQGLVGVLRADFHDKQLWGFKDPRICRLLPMWHGIFDDLGVVPGYCLLARHPDEVAASLWARGGYSYNQALLLWLGHMLEAERQTRSRQRVLLTYDQITGDWRRQAWKIAVALGIFYPRSPENAGERIDQFLEPSLRHHRAGQVATAGQAVCLRGADARIARWAFRVYDLLAAAAADKYSRVDPAALDAVAGEFGAAIAKLASGRPAREKVVLS